MTYKQAFGREKVKLKFNQLQILVNDVFGLLSRGSKSS